MKNLVVLLVMLVAMTASSYAAESFLIQNDDGTLLSRPFVPDGSGGMMLGAQDNIGAWGGADYGWTPVMGDIDADGYDEFLLYNGTLLARSIVSDGSGGLQFGAQDNIGAWGDTSWAPQMGDVDGGNDEAIMYSGSANGATFIKELIPDGSGGLMFGGTDGLGSYGDTTWTHVMGDVDGDGYDEFFIYRASDGLTFERALVDDGSGGLMFGAQDTIGNWSGTNSIPLTGDIDGDGTDEFLLYDSSSGNILAKKLVDDGSGGLKFAAATDTIGTWGGTGWTPLSGNIVPEPATIGLLVLGFGLLRRR